MAGFKTHITASTVLGVGYGAAAHLGFGVPLERCMLAAGLCSVSGMLPDIDSDSGVPLRETITFGAAIVPMMMIDRFQKLGMSHESMDLAAMLIYIVIRFGVAEIFRRYTKHRGMWHSLPAAASVGLLAYLLCEGTTVDVRLFKAGAVVLGFMSHLVLDEIYSIQWKGLRLRVKRSFGTALKLYGKDPWANISTYGKLFLLAALTIADPFVMQKLHRDGAPPGLESTVVGEQEDATRTANEGLEELLKQGGELWR